MRLFPSILLLSSASCLTWPQLQQVVQRLDMSFEIHGTRYLFTVTESLPSSSSSPPSSSSPRPPGLLGGGEEHRAKADREVLVRHPVGGAEGRHQAEVVQQERQGGLERETEWK